MKRHKTIKELNLKNKPKITVIAYDDLYEYIPKEKSMLIRLHIEKDEDLSFKENYIDILNIDVIDEWDLNNPNFKGKLFTEKNAKDIYEFVCKNINEVEEIVVHCKAGLSRSPAIAICILNYIGERDVALNYVHSYRCMPNRLIMEIMTLEDKTFFKDFLIELEKRRLYRGYEDLIERKGRKSKNE